VRRTARGDGARVGWATDAIIAVLDAKYHYNFWRPITAIRNGDMDGNPATNREATWQPIANTPMHPGIPVRTLHPERQRRGCRQGGVGTARHPEIAIPAPSAPGVTHRWSNMTALPKRLPMPHLVRLPLPVLNRVGTEMGLQIGEYVAKNVMQPVATSSR